MIIIASSAETKYGIGSLLKWKKEELGNIFHNGLKMIPIIKHLKKSRLKSRKSRTHSNKGNRIAHAITLSRTYKSVSSRSYSRSKGIVNSVTLSSDEIFRGLLMAAQELTPRMIIIDSFTEI